MAREVIQKKAYCKNAVFLHTGRLTLQSALTDAMSKRKTVGSRKQKQGENEKYISSIIYHRTEAGMLFGILAAYEKGTHQLTLAEDDTAEMLTVQQVAPPERADKKRQEFIEGICYFGIMKNHVVIVTSRALDARDVERYFNWLLVQSRSIVEGDYVALSDQIGSATKEKIQRSHVKSINIGTPLIKIVEGDEVTSVERSTSKIEYGGMGLDMLRYILGQDKLDKLKVSDALDGNIEVSLKISYKRKTTERGHKMLDTIALAARNLHEEDVTLDLASGGKVTGSEMKLSKMLTLAGRDGIVDPDDLFPKVRAWLKQLLDDAIIDP